MSVNPVSDETLHAALAPFRVDPATFEAAVRERWKSAEIERATKPVEGLSPRLKTAAAFLPLEILTGGKVTGITAQMAPASGVSKLVAYLAFPAVSLFVLLGAAIFSFAKIRSIQQKSTAVGEAEAMSRAISEWWRRHRWGAGLVYGSTLGLMLFGATWLLFPVYIVSFGLLVYFVASLGKLGLGNRYVVGFYCMLGLVMLQTLGSGFWVGDAEIHFVDQSLVSAVFYLGWFLLMAVFLGGLVVGTGRARFPSGFPPLRAVLAAVVAVGLSLFAVSLILPMIAKQMSPILRPTRPSDIKQYVESFDKARFSSARWHEWEIVARWAIDAKLAPDLSKPRRLLARELAGGQNPSYFLGCALRLGLMRPDELGQLKDYQKQRQYLFNDPGHLLETEPIGSLEQKDWVIRTAVMRNDLSREERDVLQKRLNATLDDLPGGPYDYEVLLTALRATQLLRAIDRPVDRDRYRPRVHDWLRQHHCKNAGGFELAGGFKTHLDIDSVDIRMTAHAVELMEFYGIPDGLDLNWLRSYLRPSSRRRSPYNWIAAVTLDRLNHLPGVTHPTWLEVLYYERNLIAAAVLVGLCVYATLSSPQPKMKPAGMEEIGTV